MDRRTALATAAAAALVAATGTAAVAANLGLLERNDAEPAGQLSPVEVIADEQAPVVVVEPAPAPPEPASLPGDGEDHHDEYGEDHDDDEYEGRDDDEYGEDHHDDDDDEYEGRDDDD